MDVIYALGAVFWFFVIIYYYWMVPPLLKDKDFRVKNDECDVCGGSGKITDYGEMHYPPGWDQNCYGGGGEYFEPYRDVIGESPCSVCGGTGKSIV